MNKLDEIRVEIADEVIDGFMGALEEAIGLTFSDMDEEECSFTEMAVAKSVMTKFVRNFFELLEDSSDSCCEACSNCQASLKVGGGLYGIYENPKDSC